MTEQRIKHILDGFPRIKVAVIGDYFLDKWLTIDRSLDDVSVETKLTAYQVVGKRIFAGAAGTVTSNLSALDIGELYAVGFIGDDGEGFELLRDLHAKRVNTDYLIRSTCVMTPTYTKPMFLANGVETESNRLDFKNKGVTPAELEAQVVQNLWAVAPQVDAIIALDQIDDANHGVITGRVREELAKVADAYPNLIVYADSRAFIDKFRNIIVKCNDLEAVRIVRPDLAETKQELDVVKACLTELAKLTGRRAFVTCGKRGVLALRDDGEAALIPAPPDTGPVDTVGAGDACTSGIVSSLCAGATAEEAALVGNLVSSITVQFIGECGTASREGVLKRFGEHYGAPA
ncbi:MAG: PfkB family carbohydrate kinase [Kiritimatiellaeota bacterium]|nr:PfkB family carbohydrate kinase [Kiritimatiellota bacterium]